MKESLGLDNYGIGSTYRSESQNTVSGGGNYLNMSSRSKKDMRGQDIDESEHYRYRLDSA